MQATAGNGELRHRVWHYDPSRQYLRSRDDRWPLGGPIAEKATPGAAGHVLWKRQTGTENSDGASDVALDVKGNVYLTGMQQYDFDYKNAWLGKFGPAGGLHWRRGVGSIDFHYVRAIAIDTKGSVNLAGSSTPGYAWLGKHDGGGPSGSGCLGWCTRERLRCRHRRCRQRLFGRRDLGLIRWSQPRLLGCMGDEEKGEGMEASGCLAPSRLREREGASEAGG